MSEPTGPRAHPRPVIAQLTDNLKTMLKASSPRQIFNPAGVQGSRNLETARPWPAQPVGDTNEPAPMRQRQSVRADSFADNGSSVGH
jgi:hypothetical protein